MRSWQTRVLAVTAVALVFLAGRWSTSWWSQSAETGTQTAHDHAAMNGDDATPSAEPTLWTCPMHPEIQLPESGDCPKCGMDLVPMAKGGDTGPRQLAMSPASVALASIQTVQVTRQFLTKPVRLVGKVDYDETRVRTIAARFGGRLDRLYVDYTGVTVKKNDHLVWLYSPALLTGQQELIEAKKRFDTTSADASAFQRDSNKRGYESARDKLLLWGLAEDQVSAIEQRGTAEDHMLIRSPASGVVIHKALKQGDYIKEGTAIYRIADLSQLWVQLDAYEQDLPWLRYGQAVSINIEAFPGRVFEGWISFLDPTVDERTRTVKVRVNVANPDGELKPGMFVRAVVQSRVGHSGHVLEPRLQGKWISPMHPEIVKDGPGKCDVCGMDLVPAESLLQRSTALEEGKPLTVPASAVLVTGARAVVYVEVQGKKKPTFEGREIILGPRAGDYYIVLAGLSDTDRVVVNGAFRIDSSMQIQAKPSMMSMQGDANTFTGPTSSVFRLSLEALYSAYAKMQQALASDDLDAAHAAVTALRDSLDNVNSGGLPRQADVRWQEEKALLAQAAKNGSEAATIEQLRTAFGAISGSILTLENTFRHAGEALRFEAYCPMAMNGQGASWLQGDRKILNPYFGASMLTCGEIRTEFTGVREDTRTATETQSKKTDQPPTLPPQLTQEPKPRVEKSPTPQPVKPAPVRPQVHGFDTLITAYLRLQTALAADQTDKAHEAFSKLRVAVTSTMVHGEGDLANSTTEALSQLKDAVTAPVAKDIEALRKRFDPATMRLLAMQKLAGNTSGSVLYVMHCPMAFDNTGADWLQRDKTLVNPYFGASMLHCGTIKMELPPVENK
ncbi:MAG: Cu(I)/Ag(I) efflux system membrane fusion protein [Planctomycetota bacterium]|jgi:Cu(I)/Ag(I) efflux system membrane fusion protein